MSGLRAPTELDLSAANLATAWKQWRRDWRYYAAARDLDSKPIAMQVGTFFNCAGPAAQETSSHFSWTEEGEQNGLTDKLAGAFRQLLQPKMQCSVGAV